MNFFRLHVLPPLAKHVFSLDVVRKLAFPLVSQIGINYRHSSLSNHAGDEDFEEKPAIVCRIFSSMARVSTTGFNRRNFISSSLRVNQIIQAR